MHTKSNPSGQIIVTEEQAGEPLEAGGYRLTPMGKATRLHVPGTLYRAVWNRPSSIVAETPEGETVVIPIKDYTRIAQVTILGIGIGVSALLWLLSGMLHRR
jgi:hypothetical protein